MANEAITTLDPTGGPASGQGMRLADLMIVLVGLAIALASGAHLLVLLAAEATRLAAAATAHRQHLLDNGPEFWRATHGYLRNTLSYGFQLAEAFLAAMTPVFFVLRLKRPRPALRAVVRNAGTVAGLSIIFGLF
jgi:hypothetical protein